MPPRREGVTILLVEDDGILRALTRKLLLEHGYRVLEAEDGKAALRLIGTQQAPISLTLTDVVMKEMNGPDLVLRLLDSHPAMKFVYMSGYTGELVANHGLNSGIPLLEKPFTRSALLKTLDAVLR
jgi:CheY-like chemotaxis protein